MDSTGLPEDREITWNHGGGGRATYELIKKITQDLSNFHPDQTPLSAGTSFEIDEEGKEKEERKSFFLTTKEEGEQFAFITNTYIESPPFFPGGDIGKLAVYSTVNELATMRAKPLRLSVAFVLEVGFPRSDLDRIVHSIVLAANEASVRIVVSNINVVTRIKVKSAEQDTTPTVIININALGVVKAKPAEQPLVQPGDQILLSGYFGEDGKAGLAEHGVATMIARMKLEQTIDVKSDMALVSPLISGLLNSGVGKDVHCLRYPTVGGIARALTEIADHAQVSITLDENKIVVRPTVRALLPLLGPSYLHVANAGKVLVVVAKDAKDDALDIMRIFKLGRHTEVIGWIGDDDAGKVYLYSSSSRRTPVDIPYGHAFHRKC